MVVEAFRRRRPLRRRCMGLLAERGGVAAGFKAGAYCLIITTVSDSTVPPR